MSQDSTYLDERAAEIERQQKQARRDRAALVWLTRDKPIEARLVSFDTWCRRELERRLEWSWAGPHKEKRIEQCRHVLAKMVRGLWQRGWLLDGRRLAERITELLDNVGSYQRAGKVGNFWAYFNAAVSRFVGQNSEELQAEAMQAGMHVGQVFQTLSRQLASAPSIPEAIAQRDAETLRERVSRQRRQQAIKAADAAQLPLL